MKYIDRFIDVFWYQSSGTWKHLEVCGVDLHIQKKSTYLGPNVGLGDISVYISKKLVDPLIKKIAELSKRWVIIDGCTLYCKPEMQFKNHSSGTLLLQHYLKFRLSDCVGDNEYGTDGEIPEDIKDKIISEVKHKFGKHHINIDEFGDRGYLIFEVRINID